MVNPGEYIVWLALFGPWLLVAMMPSTKPDRYEILGGLLRGLFHIK